MLTAVDNDRSSVRLSARLYEDILRMLPNEAISQRSDETKLSGQEIKVFARRIKRFEPELSVGIKAVLAEKREWSPSAGKRKTHGRALNAGVREAGLPVAMKEQGLDQRGCRLGLHN